MHWISFLPKALLSSRSNPENQADAHAAEARDCALAMAAYLPPGGGIMAGGCFVQLLDLIDDATDATPEAATMSEAAEAANPEPQRH